MLKEKIVIWGTGKYGSQFMESLLSYQKVYRCVFGVDLLDNILYFVDKNTKKQGMMYYGKKVKSPDFLFNDNIKQCIVTIRMNGQPVYEELLQHEIEAEASIDFVESIQKEVLCRRNEIFEKYNVAFLTKEVTEFEELVSNIKYALSIVENINDYVLNYIIFSLLIDNWNKFSHKYENFANLKNEFQIDFLVGAFSWFYGYEISELSRWCTDNIKVKHKIADEKATIGIVIQRYYGGGIEKVISLLLPMYIKNGHKVILLTDQKTYDKEAEYELPEGAIRDFLEYDMEGNQQERIYEILRCVDKYKIDVMCFHSGYVRVETFYEMLAMKLYGIPTLMEIHSALQTIMQIEKISNHLIDMYKIADQLIVLSEEDKQYLSKIGCASTYIQNPVDLQLKEKQPQRFREHADTIVWVGRIVQNPKCVLDTVSIMLEVVKKFPDAKLRIVGSIEDGRTYNVLVEKIKSNNLQNNLEICQYQPNIVDIYKGADIVLMTSVSESFSNVILESKVLGIPLVMYELPWLELTKDGKGYTAVKQRDTYGAAKKIIALLSDSELRMRVAKEARESAIPFLERDVYKDWNELFLQILNKNEKEE